MIGRSGHERQVLALLGRHRVVAILGPRQVGKSTLARRAAAARRGSATFFDLEDPRDLARLADPMLALAPLRGLVVLDEIQRRPELFPVLRVLADRRPVRARFLVLGSASPDLLRQTSESLAAPTTSSGDSRLTRSRGNRRTGSGCGEGFPWLVWRGRTPRAPSGGASSSGPFSSATCRNSVSRFRP